MSFFKDLKEDIAQSVNELAESLDENLETAAEADAQTGDTKAEKVPATEDIAGKTPLAVDYQEKAETVGTSVTQNLEEELVAEPVKEEPEAEKAVDDMKAVALESEDQLPEEQEEDIVSEEIKEEVVEDVDMMQEGPSEVEEEDVQEVTVITKGTTITGGIKSDTSLVVKGTIEGDVECQGKLTITGKVAGNTIASEIYVNTPRLEGDINSKGIVKIDVGTVVIGNISCTSVLVAGAVKGNIEVNGPVIVDSTAVVKGDIKAKAIQINSGAVIDGHCALSYADVDLDSFFE